MLGLVAGAYVLSSRHVMDESKIDPVSSTSQVASTSSGVGISALRGNPTEVSVRVVYFGMPLTVTGTKKETVVLPAPAYLSDLKNALVKLHPGLETMFQSMLFLVDGVSANGNPQLANNWEVDILALGVGG